ncbi:hypothetical protein FA13DRAFT_1712397 [Coprinellus micaceus]|uniref:Uncharacterized protein n=1 Tax=Coprinellus micaceus TaxID=71717 RepID=A0A4Y7T202_COPMI|nr:hypothetical protein FA13DRAFT_1712397 [Coprinellus micaceus]
MLLPLETFRLAPLEEPLQTLVSKWIDVLQHLSPATESSAGHVASWFSHCIGCDAQLLGATEVAVLFPDVQWLQHTGQASELRKLFLGMRDTVSRQLFREDQLQNSQHNLLEDLIKWHKVDVQDYGAEEDLDSQPLPSRGTPTESTRRGP